MTDVRQTFGAAPIRGWDVSSVTNMFDAFRYAAMFSAPIGAWNVSKVMNMGATFSYACTSQRAHRRLGRVVGDGHVRRVRGRRGLRHGGWDTPKEASMHNIFYVGQGAAPAPRRCLPPGPRLRPRVARASPEGGAPLRHGVRRPRLLRELRLADADGALPGTDIWL